MCTNRHGDANEYIFSSFIVNTPKMTKIDFVIKLILHFVFDVTPFACLKWTQSQSETVVLLTSRMLSHGNHRIGAGGRLPISL